MTADQYLYYFTNRREKNELYRNTHRRTRARESDFGDDRDRLANRKHVRTQRRARQAHQVTTDVTRGLVLR